MGDARNSAMRRITYIALLLIVVASFQGCTYGDPGEQAAGAFYFPVSVAVHPFQSIPANIAAGQYQYAYVVSSNFDLGYNHGSVKVVDLAELEREIALDQAGTGCGGGKKCADGFFVATIIESSTIRIGSFGGVAIVTPDGQRLFVAQRQDEAVSYATLGDYGRTLDCGQNSKGGQFIGSCSPSNYTQTGGFDPFDLAWGPSIVNQRAGCEYVSHLRDSDIVCLWGDGSGLIAFLSLMSNPDNYSSVGFNDISYNPVTGLMAFSSKYTFGNYNVLMTGDANKLLTIGSGADQYLWYFDPSGVYDIEVDSIIGTGEQKNVIQSDDGSQVFLLTKGPDVILKMVRGWDQITGEPTFTIVDYVPVGIGSNRMFRLEVPGLGHRLIYVPCTFSDYVHVIDADSMEEVALLEDPSLDGPYWVSFYLAPGGWRVIVGNFESSQLSVYSVDPSTYVHTLLAVVGAPRQGGF